MSKCFWRCLGGGIGACSGVVNFYVQYGEGATRVESLGDSLQLYLSMPVLGGEVSESWSLAAQAGAAARWRKEGNWLLADNAETLWACALSPAGDDVLEQTTGALYAELLALMQGWQMQRIWHYLPRINECDAAGLERYRAFCRGRSLAFETVFGTEFHTRLPAASAVGCEGDVFVIYACACKQGSVRYLENPLQMPAYRYSPAFGPRAPGFARASLTLAPESSAAASAAGVVRQREIFISGTASIREERSLVGDGIGDQLDITVENLNRIAAECGLEAFLSDAAAITAGQRRFKVYLRNAGDYVEVSHRLGALLGKADKVIYLHSEICRAELDIEIEASVRVAER